MSLSYRLNRLFAPDGKCFDVAIDHGFFNESTFLSGIEDPARAIAAVVAASPDAIQLPPGSARILQSIPGPRKPALVLRTDTANVYGSMLPATLHSELIQNAVEQALRLDAACIVVNLLSLPGQSELLNQCVKNVCALKSECDRFGMPLMVEPLVMQSNEVSGGYQVDGEIKKILPLVRMAVELGADIIKCDPCSDISEFHRNVEIAGGFPVLVRGGGRATDEEILVRTAALMVQGASGIVYGRNVIQHPTPTLMTQALMSIVHDGKSGAEALELLV
ncbi:FbaB DhnA-type fructose-1,6-bisphosphate aldolase and related enzymes [Fimbriimonadaceae bacterium]